MHIRIYTQILYKTSGAAVNLVAPSKTYLHSESDVVYHLILHVCVLHSHEKSDCQLYWCNKNSSGSFLNCLRTLLLDFSTFLQRLYKIRHVQNYSRVFGNRLLLTGIRFETYLPAAISVFLLFPLKTKAERTPFLKRRASVIVSRVPSPECYC